MTKGFTLGIDAVNQIRALIRGEMSRYNLHQGTRGRYFRGGGSGCDSQNCKLQITVFGNPTGGTFDIDLSVNGNTEALTFDYNDAASAVETELATHTQLTAADVTVTGGPFPNQTVEIEFVNDFANMDIAIPLSDWTSLTGGSGVATVCSKSQVGHPGAA